MILSIEVTVLMSVISMLGVLANSIPAAVLRAFVYTLIPWLG